MEFVWNDINVEHIATHGMLPDEAEYVVECARPPYPRMVGEDKRLVIGRLRDGRYTSNLCPVAGGCRRRVRHALQAVNGFREAAVSQEEQMKRREKHPEEMSAAELARATREFDEPFAFERGRPMSAGARAEESRLRRGRPKVGTGARKISISLEGELLRRADAMAKKRGVNRSQLIAGFVAYGLGRKAG